MKYPSFRRYWLPIVLVGFAAMLLVLLPSEPLLELRPTDIEWQLLLGITGTVLSVIFFVQKQKLEETRLFRELFTEFNKRYDELNERLNAILTADDVKLTTDERNTLDDYFNLCAEEYLFFRSGYIPPLVWEAWRNGMRVFMRNARIRAYWEQDSKSASYYGLELSGQGGARLEL